MALISVDEAIAYIDRIDAPPLSHQQLNLSEAGGRILAQPILAPFNQPPFDASAMDGYAIRALDLKHRQSFALIGVCQAGHPFAGEVKSGQAVRIFTGAALPKGADMVVMQEYTQKCDNGSITIMADFDKSHRHIRPIGNDFKKGQQVLAQGQQLTPAALALLGACGKNHVLVNRKLRVALLATGDELVPPGTEPGPNQIMASNSLGLAQIIKFYGGTVIDLGITSDDEEALSTQIQKARDLKADIIVTSGGVSVGEYDLLKQTLAHNGMERYFWKIAMRPGKPLLFGRFGRTPQSFVLGLPGNPISSLICAHLFLVPLMARLNGLAYQAPIAQAKLEKDLAPNGERRHYIRAKVEIKNGELCATPDDNHDSSMLTLMAKANALIIHQEHSPALKKGDFCRVFIPESGL